MQIVVLNRALYSHILFCVIQNDGRNTRNPKLQHWEVFFSRSERQVQHKANKTNRISKVSIIIAPKPSTSLPPNLTSRATFFSFFSRGFSTWCHFTYILNVVEPNCLHRAGININQFRTVNKSCLYIFFFDEMRCVCCQTIKILLSLHQRTGFWAWSMNSEVFAKHWQFV